MKLGRRGFVVGLRRLSYNIERHKIMTMLEAIAGCQLRSVNWPFCYLEFLESDVAIVLGDDEHSNCVRILSKHGETSFVKMVFFKRFIVV